MSPYLLLKLNIFNKKQQDSFCKNIIAQIKKNILITRFATHQMLCKAHIIYKRIVA